MKIILLRHGKPIKQSVGKIEAFSFLNWIESYNASGLCPTSLPTKDALSVARHCNAIVCSELPRSIESAEALKADMTLSHSCFNEAGLPCANWRGIKLSPQTWAFIFRIAWFFGYSNQSESYREAKIRAENSAKELIELANEQSSVLFVGHGIYNKLLAKHLRALGWTGPRNPGSKYWHFGIYEKNRLRAD